MCPKVKRPFLSARTGVFMTAEPGPAFPSDRTVPTLFSVGRQVLAPFRRFSSADGPRELRCRRERLRRKSALCGGAVRQSGKPRTGRNEPDWLEGARKRRRRRDGGMFFRYEIVPDFTSYGRGETVPRLRCGVFFLVFQQVTPDKKLFSCMPSGMRPICCMTNTRNILAGV